MTDLVKRRLRSIDFPPSQLQLCREAADRIEQLETWLKDKTDLADRNATENESMERRIEQLEARIDLLLSLNDELREKVGNG